jgi:hypothetical protein
MESALWTSPADIHGCDLFPGAEGISPDSRQFLWGPAQPIFLPVSMDDTRPPRNIWAVWILPCETGSERQACSGWDG